MNNFEKIRQEIQSWYPPGTFTDTELHNATVRLIRFCQIGAEIMQSYKSDEQEPKEDIEKSEK